MAAGVEMIELDVLRPRSEFPTEPTGGGRRRGRCRRAPRRSWSPTTGATRRRREPLTLDEALDAFTRAPLDGVEIDCDLKIAGREDEVVAALRERDLMERASISTMEVSSLRELRRLDPGLRLGWTVPKVTRDWNSVPWAKPLVIARTRLAATAPAGKRPPPGAGLGVRLDLGL